MTHAVENPMNLTLNELQRIETNLLREVITICERNDLLYFLVYGSALGTVRHQGPIPWDYDVDIAIPYPQLGNFIKVLRTELSDKYYLNYHDNDPYYPELFPRIGLKGYSTKTLHLDVFLLVGAPTQKRKQFWLKTKFRFYMYAFKYGNFNEIHFGKFTTLKQKLFAPVIRTVLWPIPKKWIKRKFKALCEAQPFDQATFIVNAQFGYGMKEFIPKEYYAEGEVLTYEDIAVKIPKQYHKYLSHIYGDYMQVPSEKNRQTPDFYTITKQNTSRL